jgi:hypothetical protein
MTPLETFPAGAATFKHYASSSNPTRPANLRGSFT